MVCIRLLEGAEKCKENWTDERKNIPCEIFYVVNFHVSGKILEDRNIWGDMGLMEIKVTCFSFGRKNPIKTIRY